MALVNLTGGIITGGLGRPATESLITRFFHLHCVIAVVVDVNPGGGGFYPKPAHNVLQPGDINDFYKEVDLDKRPVENSKAYDLAKQYRVTIRIKLGSHEGQSEYVVDQKRKNFIVGIARIINNTVGRINVTVSNISSVTRRLAFKVKKMVSRN